MKKYRIIKITYKSGKIYYQVQKLSLLGFWKTYALDYAGMHCDVVAWKFLRCLGEYFDNYDDARKVYEKESESDEILKIEEV